MVSLNSSNANAFLHKLTSGLAVIAGFLPTVVDSLSQATVVIPHTGTDWAAFGLGVLGLLAHTKDVKDAVK